MDMLNLILKPDICYFCMILNILKIDCIIIVIVVNIVAHKIKILFVKTIIMRGVTVIEQTMK